jgi:hypothetical protein
MRRLFRLSVIALTDELRKNRSGVGVVQDLHGNLSGDKAFELV